MGQKGFPPSEVDAEEQLACESASVELSVALSAGSNGYADLVAAYFASAAAARSLSDFLLERLLDPPRFGLLAGLLAGSALSALLKRSSLVEGLYVGLSALFLLKLDAFRFSCIKSDTDILFGLSIHIGFGLSFNRTIITCLPVFVTTLAIWITLFKSI